MRSSGFIFNAGRKVTTLHKYLFGLIFFILPSIAHAKPSLCDRAMDSVYIASGIGGGYHRHFDGGHTILGAFSACDKVLQDKHLVARIVEVGKSLYRDFVTPRGMPLVTLNQLRVNRWRPMLSQIGLSTRTIYELNSFTPLKAFYTVLTAVVIAYDWDVQDVDRYTEFVLSYDGSECRIDESRRDGGFHDRSGEFVREGADRGIVCTYCPSD